MTEREQGRREGLLSALRPILLELADGKEFGQALLELEETRSALRQLVEDFDVDYQFTDTLYLPDMVRSFGKRLVSRYGGVE